MECICGNNQFEVTDRPGILIDTIGEANDRNIKTGLCNACGLIRQVDISFSTEKEYSDYYKNEYPPVKESYTKKTYDHDKDLAILRCNEYGIDNGCNEKILDVGSGSGAFVDECRGRDADAYGCEISKYHYSKSTEFIYQDRLENIHFPTDYFDKLTCHDVLEHVLDPARFISEMFRIIKQGGMCIIDIPNFFHESGKHHWKDTEHIWFFNIEQLEKLLKDTGFFINAVKHPIESKTVFYAAKPAQKRTKILLPPGMGDSLWSLIKLQSFIEKNNLKPPVDAYIVCPRERKYEGHKRSVPFLKLFPFVNSTGIVYEFGNNPEHRKIWKNAYARAGDTVFKDVLGCDYFISYNGYTIGKKTLENADEYECNWTPPMFVSLEQDKYKEECIKKYGKYLVLYFPFYGMYQSWIKNISMVDLAESINQIITYTGFTPIFVGAKWDEDDINCSNFRTLIKNAIDLTGKTSTDQIFGLIRGAQGMLAFPSGLSIMATILQQKILIIWNNYWKEDKNFATKFAWNCCPPATRNKTYIVEMANNLTIEKLVNSSIKLIRGESHEMKVKPVTIKDKAVKTKIISNNIKNKVKKNCKYPNITIVCVLKSGGDFNLDYVIRLRNMIARNTTVPYRFICLSDINIDPGICNSIKLMHDYNRWWSKIEMFRPGLVDSEYIIYFDLDSVILRNIDEFLITKHDFIALKPWNRTNQNNGLCASGMMGWKNDGTYSFIYDQFKPETMNDYPVGDQQYISKILADNHKKPVFFQDLYSGIYSYKRNCRRHLPANAKIVCFHGRPRPADVKTRWVVDNWK